MTTATENSEVKQTFAQKLLTAGQGRTTTFLIAYFVVGLVLQCVHKLDATFITFMTVHMGYVIGHSIKEDYFKNGLSQ